MAKESDRPLRADARRNRDKIVATAVRMFDVEGLDVNFDRIAKEAGVGAGTLYRNFPTRESLVAAAYFDDLAWLCDGARDLLDVLPAHEALRTWLGRLLDYATSRAGMAEALLAMISAPDHPFADSSAHLCTAISLLLKAGVGRGHGACRRDRQRRAGRGDRGRAGLGWTERAHAGTASARSRRGRLAGHSVAPRARLIIASNRNSAERICGHRKKFSFAQFRD